MRGAHAGQFNSPSIALSAGNEEGQLSEQTLLSMGEDDYMSPVQVAFFKERLLLEKTKITLTVTLASTDAVQVEATADPSDRASAEEAHSSALRAAQRDFHSLEQIDRAIARIESGEYGWCLDTGEPIGVARLLAQPTAELTVEAQGRREKTKKMTN